MNEIFAAVEGRPKRRQGISGQTIEAQMRGTMCQITEYELDVLREEIARLTAERDTARAETAMAFEVAAEAAYQWWDDEDAQELRETVRTLTPADAKAALDRMLREAKAEGMREAALVCETDEFAWEWDECRDVILSLAKDMEAGK